MDVAAPARARHGYDLRPYIEHFGEALLASDLCVARSGGSIFEVAAHGRPAILIPYPHATGDHQASNARWMAEAGAAVVVPDDELTPQRLRAEVDALLADPRAAGRDGAGVARLARRARTPRADVAADRACEAPPDERPWARGAGCTSSRSAAPG